ncbi:hypothetical protein BT63DRAFT_439538, partial [Microthyrium microscopicum]
MGGHCESTTSKLPTLSLDRYSTSVNSVSFDQISISDSETVVSAFGYDNPSEETLKCVRAGDREKPLIDKPKHSSSVSSFRKKREELITTDADTWMGAAKISSSTFTLPQANNANFRYGWDNALAGHGQQFAIWHKRNTRPFRIDTTVTIPDPAGYGTLILGTTEDMERTQNLQLTDSNYDFLVDEDPESNCRHKSIVAMEFRDDGFLTTVLQCSGKQKENPEYYIWRYMIKIWSTKNSKQHNNRDHVMFEGMPMNKLSRDGRLFAYQTFEKCIPKTIVLDAESGEEVWAQEYPGEARNCWAMEFSKDCTRLLSQYLKVTCFKSKKFSRIVEIINLADGSLLHKISLENWGIHPVITSPTLRASFALNDNQIVLLQSASHHQHWTPVRNEKKSILRHIKSWLHKSSNAATKHFPPESTMPFSVVVDMKKSQITHRSLLQNQSSAFLSPSISSDGSCFVTANYMSGATSTPRAGIYLTDVESGKSMQMENSGEGLVLNVFVLQGDGR